MRTPLCNRCFNLPWRVKGSRCSCGLERAEERFEVSFQRPSALGAAQDDSIRWGRTTEEEGD